ncbi:MAG: IS66 family transposase [Candidatus Thiodiazotropha weberae]|nr:IS66 family transposase [Candidatus Thiodiazotropha lotti]MCG8010169.1 IS66 family transposase [Candidatus Thiodiazotropha lotti]MCG8021634.1 IS66 family transposase [Candidatus Thiodiazotropha lotti]MCW4208803.1 IS66 family transposase [Candidatus Thiodiazotropha lotti]MCW4209627.1 IS66 family transposase [Candidatus Thiodiazotropha lotti]
MAKHANFLTLYRLEKILKPYCTTMTNWVIRQYGLFKPLADLIRVRLLTWDYLLADATRLQALKENGKLVTSDKWR